MSIRRQQQQLCFKIKPDGLKNFDWAAVVSTNEYLDRKNKFFAKELKKVEYRAAVYYFGK